MQILTRVESSVLWIGTLDPLAEVNLRMSAALAGVSGDRLIFAPKLPIAAHLERLAAADIALDTTPCNGHTTTSDALWCGVPVVSVKGTTFAGRVSESLLAAVGLPELVAPDLPSFVRLTDALAQDGNRLSVLRQHLLAARDSEPLFDTAGLTRAIEAAYLSIV